MFLTKKEKKKEIAFGMVSHEIKSMLASVKAYTQLLKRKLGESKDEKVPYYLDRLDMQVDSLTSLVADALDLGRMREERFALQKETFALHDFLEEVIREMPVEKQAQIFIKEDVGRKVMADRSRLRRVVLILIDHALQYAPADKKVILEIGEQKRALTIGITDFGPVIDEENVTSVFKPLYDSRSLSGAENKGLGLSLFLAQVIIKAHKGTMRAHSTADQGTTLSFTLPLS